MTDKLREELRRIMPILKRLEDCALWNKLSAGTGVATLNGLRAALAAPQPADSRAEFEAWIATYPRGCFNYEELTASWDAWQAARGEI